MIALMNGSPLIRLRQSARTLNTILNNLDDRKKARRYLERIERVLRSAQKSLDPAATAPTPFAQYTVALQEIESEIIAEIRHIQLADDTSEDN